MHGPKEQKTKKRDTFGKTCVTTDKSDMSTLFVILKQIEWQSRKDDKVKKHFKAERC